MSHPLAVRQGTDTDVSERVELRGRLSEFRDALEAEARAVRSGAGGNAVGLRHGRRVLHGAGLHHYQFQIDFPQRLAADAPAKLVVEGRAPVNVVIEEAKGLAITVVAPEDLGPAIAHASLQTDMSFLLERLVQRLEEAADRPNPVGDRVIGDAQPRTGRSGELVDSRYRLLAEQEHALRQALEGDVFIWGPPGTGKTQTIGAIVAELMRRGRSVLLVSHTNSAVDGGLARAVRNLSQLSEHGSGFEEGDLVRVGMCKDRRLQDDFDPTRPPVLARSVAKRRTAAWEEELAGIERIEREGHERVARLRRLLDLHEFHHHARSEIEGFRGALDRVVELAAQTAAAAARAREELAARDALEPKVRAVSRLQGAQLRADELTRQLADQRALLEQCVTRRELLTRQLVDAEEILVQSESTGRLTRLYKRLPPPEEQHAIVEGIRAELASAEADERDARQRSDNTGTDLIEQHRLIADARGVLGDDQPEAVVRRASDTADRARRASAEGDQLAEERREGERSLGDQLRERLTLLFEEGLTDPASIQRDLRGQLEALQGSLQRIAAELTGFDVAHARNEIASTERDIAEGRRRAEELKALIAEAEQQVIEQAQVVACTLTAAYLRDPIVARTFDVVILDEASMAPIPSLYFAAGLATTSAVVVGDFRQLPPIVISEDDAAARWLGRDVFEIADVTRYERSTDPPEWFVMLREQKRMRPEISRVVNRFIYGGKLRDGTLASHDEPWIAADWPHRDTRVLLVDLSNSGAWVSRVPSGRHSSKVNFYSATACVDLAGALLDRTQPHEAELETPRVAIISRYRPHASICELLIERRGLVPQVQAGTAHSFQGAEAETVIVDVVDAPPVWKSGLLRPDEDNDPNQRLLNVAFTRAKQRLIIVGHFDWIRKNGKRSFLQRVISDLAERHPTVAVEDLVPAALHERVAAARGMVVANRDADGDHVIADEVAYYDLLRRDLASARELVVIFSPFLTVQRLYDLQADLRAAIDRGVNFVVVSKPPAERTGNQHQVHLDSEALLRSWGAAVLHKLNAHEKLVFIDPFDRTAAVCWHGSLNTLSQRVSGELMTRERHPVVGRYAEIMALKDLVDVALDPGTDVRMCPVCGDHPLMAVDSGKTPPFLWRCEETDHYWRRKDDAAPRDGQIVCRTCGGALEFHATEKGRYWRCVDNHRHRISVHRDHLRLPAMRQLIRPVDLAALERSVPLDGRPSDREARRDSTTRNGVAEPNALTPREVQIVEFMGDHRSYREIAAELGLQPETVKSYAKAIRRKLGVTSRSEAVASARERGWLN